MNRRSFLQLLGIGAATAATAKAASEAASLPAPEQAKQEPVRKVTLRAAKPGDPFEYDNVLPEWRCEPTSRPLYLMECEEAVVSGGLVAITADGKIRRAEQGPVVGVVAEVVSHNTAWVQLRGFTKDGDA